jgi:hypothetical protein
VAVLARVDEIEASWLESGLDDMFAVYAPEGIWTFDLAIDVLASSARWMA